MDALNEDQELRPLFLDYIGKSMTLGLSDVFTVNNLSERARLHKEYYSSVQALAEKLSLVIPSDKVDEAIAEVTKYYMKKGKDYLLYDFLAENY